jgi:hypothetical protein
MATPIFAQALARAEQAFIGAAPPLPPFSAATWERVREARSFLFVNFQRSGRGGVQIAPDQADLRAAWFADWSARERDPVAHEAFVESPAYAQWKQSYLYALTAAGAFDRQIRELALYEHAADHWRRVLAQPPMGPESTLSQDIDTNMGWWPIPLYAAVFFGIFAVSLNQAGLGATIGAFALGVLTGLLMFIAMLSLFAALFGATWRAAAASWLCGLTGATVLSLGPVILAFMRRERGRWTNFFAVLAAWGPVIWLFLMPAALFVPGVGAGDRATSVARFAAAACVTIGFAALVNALLARIALFPRGR